MPDTSNIPSSLRPVCEQLRALLDGPPSPQVRYAIGVIVQHVKDAPPGGRAGAVAQLAAATGADLATLYRYASVAASWSAEEVDQLLAPHAKAGLSWSHLVLIAGVEPPEQRASWLRRCRAENLSSRRLEALLATGHGGEGDDEAVLRVERALRAAERLLEQAAALELALRASELPSRLRARAIALAERMRTMGERQLRSLHRLNEPERRSGAFARILDGTAASRPRSARRSQR